MTNMQQLMIYSMNQDIRNMWNTEWSSSSSFCLSAEGSETIFKNLIKERELSF